MIPLHPDDLTALNLGIMLLAVIVVASIAAVVQRRAAAIHRSATMGPAGAATAGPRSEPEPVDLLPGTANDGSRMGGGAPPWRDVIPPPAGTINDGGPIIDLRDHADDEWAFGQDRTAGLGSEVANEARPRDGRMLAGVLPRRLPGGVVRQETTNSRYYIDLVSDLHGVAVARIHHLISLEPALRGMGAFPVSLLSDPDPDGSILGAITHRPPSGFERELVVGENRVVAPLRLWWLYPGSGFTRRQALDAARGLAIALHRLHRVGLTVHGDPSSWTVGPRASMGDLCVWLDNVLGGVHDYQSEQAIPPDAIRQDAELLRYVLGDLVLADTADLDQQLVERLMQIQIGVEPIRFIRSIALLVMEARFDLLDDEQLGAPSSTFERMLLRAGLPGPALAFGLDASGLRPGVAELALDLALADAPVTVETRRLSGSLIASFVWPEAAIVRRATLEDERHGIRVLVERGGELVTTVQLGKVPPTPTTPPLDLRWRADFPDLRPVPGLVARGSHG